MPVQEFIAGALSAQVFAGKELELLRHGYSATLTGEVEGGTINVEGDDLLDEPISTVLGVGVIVEAFTRKGKRYVYRGV